MSYNENNEKRGFKGVWIPAKIWLNKELSLLEKCLLVEINSLDNNDGCFASNEYLADFLNTSEPTITRAIAKLKTIGDIYQSSFNGRKRSLKVKPNLIEPNQIDEAATSKRQGSLINLSKSSIVNNIDINTDNNKERETTTPLKNKLAIEYLVYIHNCLIKYKYIYSTDQKEYVNYSDLIDNLDVLNKDRIDMFFKQKKSIKPNFLNIDLREYAADLRRRKKTFSPTGEYKPTVYGREINA